MDGDTKSKLQSIFNHSNPNIYLDNVIQRYHNLLNVFLTCLLVIYVFVEPTYRDSFLSFLWQAIKELNIKTNNWKVLLTDEPFTEDGLIIFRWLWLCVNFSAITLNSHLFRTSSIPDILCRILVNMMLKKFRMILILWRKEGEARHTKEELLHLSYSSCKITNTLELF